ncbi:ATP synthase F1 subunit epsilon, partial [Butyricicoccus sp. 1XD8-22]
LVSPLSIGGVELKDANGKSEFVAVSGGFIEVRPEKVSILAPSAEVASSIDLARAQEAKARAEERLKMKNDEIDFQRAELALRRAMNRINVHEGNV